MEALLDGEEATESWPGDPGVVSECFREKAGVELQKPKKKRLWEESAHLTGQDSQTSAHQPFSFVPMAWRPLVWTLGGDLPNSFPKKKLGLSPYTKHQSRVGFVQKFALALYSGLESTLQLTYLVRVVVFAI